MCAIWLGGLFYALYITFMVSIPWLKPESIFGKTVKQVCFKDKVTFVCNLLIIKFYLLR